MKSFAISVLLALLAVKASSAAAPDQAIENRQLSLAYFTLEGNGPTLPYPNYTIIVPVNGHAVSISNPLIVYSILPTDSNSNEIEDERYNCTFIGAEGSVAQLGSQEDVVPQEQISVTCFTASTPSTALPTVVLPTISVPPLLPTLSSSTTPNTTTSPSTTSATPSSAPPYPTATKPSSKAGVTEVSASAASGTISATGGRIDSTVTPFTGDAVKAAGPILGPFFALVGLVAAL